MLAYLYSYDIGHVLFPQPGVPTCWTWQWHAASKCGISLSAFLKSFKFFWCSLSIALYSIMYVCHGRKRLCICVWIVVVIEHSVTVNWLMSWLTDCFVDWFVDCWLIDGLIHWFIDWLIDWHVGVCTCCKAPSHSRSGEYLSCCTGLSLISSHICNIHTRTFETGSAGMSSMSLVNHVRNTHVWHRKSSARNVWRLLEWCNCVSPGQIPFLMPKNRRCTELWTCYVRCEQLEYNKYMTVLARCSYLHDDASRILTCISTQAKCS